MCLCVNMYAWHIPLGSQTLSISKRPCNLEHDTPFPVNFLPVSKVYLLSLFNFFSKWEKTMYPWYSGCLLFQMLSLIYFVKNIYLLLRVAFATIPIGLGELSYLHLSWPLVKADSSRKVEILHHSVFFKMELRNRAAHTSKGSCKTLGPQD